METKLLDFDDLKGKVEPSQNGHSKKNMFFKKTANQWIDEAKKLPMPKMLFDEFWLEGELCILFSESNVGKSICGVQIAESIASGQPIKGLKLNAPAQPVAYFDFELSAKQFEGRYAIEDNENDRYTNHYVFSENLHRLEMNNRVEIPKGTTFTEYAIEQIREFLQETNIKILLIDNLTWIQHETEKAENAGPLIKQIQAAIDDFNCSTLLFAHTPKRDASKPITMNDLAGSRQIMNFIDTCFAIGKSQMGNGIRYLKQIKSRSKQTKYDTNNVMVCSLEKEFNFLKFRFLEFDFETIHLRQKKNLTPEEKAELVRKVKELKSQGLTQREIAETAAISLGSVNNYLNAPF